MGCRLLRVNAPAGLGEELFDVARSEIAQPAFAQGGQYTIDPSADYPRYWRQRSSNQNVDDENTRWARPGGERLAQRIDRGGGR